MVCAAARASANALRGGLVELGLRAAEVDFAAAGADAFAAASASVAWASRACASGESTTASVCPFATVLPGCDAQARPGCRWPVR